MKKNIKGFTLIELLVVIAIIGLLSTLAVVSLNNARIKARDARRQSDLKQISTALELYQSQNDAYPTFGTCGTGVIAADNTAAATASNLCNSAPIRDANNIYLQQVPTDPSPSTGVGGRFYRYHTDTSNPTGNTDGHLSYCISALLEGGSGATAQFVCVNGSCYNQATGC